MTTPNTETPTTTTTGGGGAADRDTLLDNVRAARGKDTAARDTAIRAAVAAGIDLVDVGTAADLSYDRVRQIAKIERTRLMAAAYVTELIEHLQQALTHVTDADQTTAAATSVLKGMDKTEITGWLELEPPLDLATTDRYDLMDDLREIHNQVRTVLRTAGHCLTRIDPDAVIAWLAPDRDTPANDDDDPRYGDAARRDEIVRALSRWCQRQRDREPKRRPPKETPATYGTYPDLYREPVEPDINDLGEVALAAFVCHLDHHYTELRAHAADTARTVSLAEWHVALIGDYDLGIGIEPTTDDYRDLLGGTWQLQHAVHNFHRIVERYYRRFDHGQGARTLTQQASTPSDDHSDACAQNALENIRRWHTEQQQDTQWPTVRPRPAARHLRTMISSSSRSTSTSSTPPTPRSTSPSIKRAAAWRRPRRPRPGYLLRWHLIDHGWMPDHRRITWVYPHAFDGAGPDGPHEDRLAEYGPHPPILQLDPDAVTVVPHGQTHGCPRHLRTVRTTELRHPNQFDAIATALIAVEEAAASADADTYRRCLEYGDCGHVIDDCEAGRRPLPATPPCTRSTKPASPTHAHRSRGGPPGREQSDEEQKQANA